MRINASLTGLNKAIRDVQKFQQEKLNEVQDVVRSSTLAIESDAISLAPVKEGNLKNSIHHSFLDNGLTGEVAASAEYAPDVEFGTKPHVIRAKPGGVLAFKVGGKMVFTKEVNHPGTAAQPFLFPAWEAQRKIFIRELRNVLSK